MTTRDVAESSAIAQRRMGSGALFRTTGGAVLLVRPSYGSTWEIPGGAIESGESPRSCCRRELVEELGLELPIGRLLVVDCVPATPSSPQGYMFVYDGGILAAGVVAQIVLPPEELIEWRLVQIEDVDQYLPVHMARRLRIAYDCAIGGTTADLEWGHAPDGAL